MFLDVGCGFGRTFYDISELFPNSYFIGLDSSLRLLKTANKILNKGVNIEIDLSFIGFKKNEILIGKSLKNIFLLQADAEEIPIFSDTIDCITSTFLIDRLVSPIKHIKNSINLLKKEGIFILTSPLNFKDKNIWELFGNRNSVVQLLKNNGIEIIEHFDKLITRIPLDSKGNYIDWNVSVICGRKK